MFAMGEKLSRRVATSPEIEMPKALIIAMEFMSDKAVFEQVEAEAGHG